MNGWMDEWMDGWMDVNGPSHPSTTHPPHVTPSTGTIVCWNVAMEAATGRDAGTVLYAKHDRCGAFTKEGAAAIRAAMAAATAPTVGGWEGGFGGCGGGGGVGAGLYGER